MMSCDRLMWRVGDLWYTCVIRSQLEAIALTGMVEGKRAGGRQRKTFMDWLSFACGGQWKINDIQKICQERNEHVLITNVRV